MQEKILEELKIIVQEFGYFPTAQKLRECHHNELLNKIYRSGENLTLYKNILGHEVKKRSHRYWYDWANLEKEIKSKFPELIKCGICPSSTTLKQFGIPSHVFQCSIHGGVVGIAKKLGCSLASGYVSRDGHFLLSTYELILDEYLYSIGVEHKPNGFLVKDRRYKYDQKIEDTYIEILGYSDKDNTKRSKIYRQKWAEKKLVYEELGFKLIFLEKDFFDKKYSFIEKQLDFLFGGLGFAIDRKFLFDINQIMSSCTGITEEFIIDSLKIIKKQIGKTPSGNDLINLKRFDLLNRVRLTGGFKKYRILLESN